MRRYREYEYEDEYEDKYGDEAEETKGRRSFIIPILLLGVLVALAGSFFVFRVEHVVVEGNIHYTDEEIKDMILDDFISQNTLLVSLLRSKENVANVSFLESVQVDYVNYNTIRIIVNEREVVGYMEYEDHYWYFDGEGMIVKETDNVVLTAKERVLVQESQNPSESEDSQAVAAETTVENYIPLVKGLELKEPEKESEEDSEENSDTDKEEEPLVQEGKKLNVTNISAFQTIATITTFVNKDNIPPEYISFDEYDNLTLYYENIEVRLGQEENLEIKMTALASIMPNVEGMPGILHLESYTSVNNDVIFENI